MNPPIFKVLSVVGRGTNNGTNRNYKAVTYSVVIEVTKPPRDIFNHLIDLSKWWPETYDGGELKLNAEFNLSSGDGHASKNKVIEFEPDKKLVWLTTQSLRKADNYDWSGTKMIFELTPQGNNTRLKFTYDGVVFEHEYDLLVKVCDMTIKEKCYDYIMFGKTK